MTGNGDREPGEELADLAAPLWSEEHTQRVLGATAEDLGARRRAGTLLGVSPRDQSAPVYYPVMQFHQHEGVVRVIPAIERFMTILRDHESWTIVVYLRMPADELDGLSPVAFINEGGDPDDLARYAEIVHRELTRH